MHRISLFAFTAFLAVAPATAQDRIDKEDARRYALELAPGGSLEMRKKTMADVAFYNNTPAMKILLEAVASTLVELDILEEDRAKNERQMRQILKPQLLNSGGDLVDYSGVIEHQALQKELGAKITLEEQVLRDYRAILPTFTESKSLETLRKYKVKKPPRLKVFLVQVYGLLDQELFTERLIELLSDKDLAVRLAAADSLSHHDARRVPPQCYGALLDDKAWEARAVAIDALGRHASAEAIEMLVNHSPFEKGKLLSDLTWKLESLTGQKLGKTPEAWVAWWAKAKGAFEPTRIVLARKVKAKGDGRISYWGIQVDSLRVVFVVDISGTMAAALDDHENFFPEDGKSRLDLARREVKSAIASLQSDAQFNVIAYNDVVLRWEDKLQKASPDTKKKAYEWLDKLVATSSTNIFDALEMAFDVAVPGTKDKYYDRTADTILFLSDGGPTAGRTTDCDEILAQVREWNTVKKVTLHTIGIGRQLNQKFIRSLAEQNGGEVRFVD